MRSRKAAFVPPIHEVSTGTDGTRMTAILTLNLFLPQTTVSFHTVHVLAHAVDECRKMKH